MREIISSSYPKMLTYGCSAHYLNLAEKELGNNVAVKHIIEVQKYFRNVHQARGWLENKQGMVPQLPNDTTVSVLLIRTLKNNYFCSCSNY